MRGLELVEEHWQRLGKVAGGLEITAIDNDVMTLDARGSSMLARGRSIADLAMALLGQEGFGRLKVQQCYSRMAIVPALELCAQRGAGAVAYWADSKYQHIATIDTKCGTPDYRRMQTKPRHSASETSLDFACHEQQQQLESILAEFADGDVRSACACHVSAADMKTHYQAAIEHGLAVSDDLLATLSATAETILVAATEQSRRGAGEA